MSSSQDRIVKAVLKLSPVVAFLIAQCTAIVHAMTGNAYFATPSPTLAAVQAAIAALAASQENAMAKTKGAAQTRNLAKKALIKLMDELRSYVQSIANSMPGQEEAVILSAKMLVKIIGVRAPRVFQALHGAVAGQALLEAPRAPARGSVFWQWSVDQKVWTDVPPTTKASTTIENLTPGTTYYFRHSDTFSGCIGWPKARRSPGKDSRSANRLGAGPA
jgi:hypothetical protein